MKYKVLKFMTRRKEGMKPYNIDDSIELTDAEAAPLLKYGFIAELPKKKEEKAVRTTKEHKPKGKRSK